MNSSWIDFIPTMLMFTFGFLFVFYWYHFFFTHIFKNHIWFHTFHTLWSIKGESNILKSGGKKCKYQIDKWITWTVLNFLSAYKKLSTIRRHVCCWFIKTKIISLLCYLHLFIHFLHEPFTAVVPTVGWGTLLGVVNQMKGRERKTICFQFQQFIYCIYPFKKNIYDTVETFDWFFFLCLIWVAICMNYNVLNKVV